MPATVGQILQLVNQIAPFELAEEWDNVGLLAGHPDSPVRRVLCALDLRMDVVKEAVRRDCQLIVTHHPILFMGRKNLREDDAEGEMLCALVRSGVAMIAAHTNFDSADPGVNDALAVALGLGDVAALENGMRLGRTKQTDFGSFCEAARLALRGPARCYGDPGRQISRVAVLGGAGGGYAGQAIAAGADAYVTGEIGYHRALDAADNGLCVIEAGHAATEYPAISLLCRGLQNAADAVQYDICVLQSESEVFF